MLRLSDDGKSAYIQLNGTPQSDGMFVWTCLLMASVGVLLWILFTQSVQISLGAMAVFAILCFLLNQKRQRIKLAQKHIFHGEICFAYYRLTHAGQCIELDTQAQICLLDDALTIQDNRHNYRISHFDNQKEMVIAQAILLGQEIGKRAVKIQMADNTNNHSSD